ncbi:MAG TPA: TIM barrel protein [Gemmatimonadaceae bacterium]|nr:TIM barrel protein [Gemmatimonadaceae bacterium]
MMERREMLAVLGAASAAQVLGGTPLMADASRDAATPPDVQAGRIRQSVCRWCYQSIPLDTLARNVAAMGFRSIELLSENEWATIKPFGLTCAVANGPSTIPVGFNRISEHDRLVKESERLLPLVAAAGIPQMIVFSGNRAGMSDAEGLRNCAIGLKRIMPLAEKLGVTVIMELLNSKVDHKDYMCDHTAWGAALVKAVGSPRFKLLYDVYHMQIMEGDVIRTIRDNFPHIGHYHTGGVPGRHEIDDAQELNYPRIMKAIADLGFTGYVAQEFIPERTPMVSLREAYVLCNV